MLTFNQAKALYDSFKSNELPRLQRLYDYYIGNHDILRKPSRDNKDDSKVVNNYAKYISTISTGYFVGNPVTYISETEQSGFESVLSIFDDNDEQTVNYNNALNCSIYGKAYELQYLDESGEYNFIDIDPRNVIVVDDGAVKPKITDAIIFSEWETADNKVKVRMDIYDADLIHYYEFEVNKDSITAKENFSFKFIKEESNDLGQVPIIEYKNNKFKQGDFETVMTLIDAYNEASSSSINDLKDFTDAYLVLTNMSGTTGDDLNDMKDTKTILLDMDGKADYLVKNVNDSYSQNTKEETKESIHKFSFVPDLTDESFGNNLSGVN